MRNILIYIFVFLFSFNLNAELKKPNKLIDPKEVIKIQLSALQKNNIPFEDAGIAQTWEFAHPSNRMFTGPIKRFTKMMYSPSYSIMLNHQNHEITEVKIDDVIAFFIIKLTDVSGNLYGFQWILEKVLDDGIYKNCWMTTSVSKPIPISKST
ncbi:MAG: hypothetical protein CFH15_01544 [Alphaproteobacteria bacterium MarineAlpha5_Bin5]|nr:MAG: hypothetical protein CFH15_01544 [Alphaproteobacteria bacterium MarineAlpha5_Bin5]|tara:strand:+ start:567 stop:1025 length:459 start_codon:yes stop_codon:yes gene_type:complete